MWRLAIKALLGDRGRLATSLLGVAFAVVLVNLQGGLLLGLIRKARLRPSKSWPPVKCVAPSLQAAMPKAPSASRSWTA
jgi:hypothetical protein